MADIVAYPVLYGQRHVVLIVESDADRASAMSTCLKKSGFHAVCVPDCERAAQLMELGVAIDIVVGEADGQEGTSGIKLAYWIMEHRPDLPLILLAGMLRIGKTELCGAEMLKQPCVPRRLEEKIRRTLKANSLRRVVKPKKTKRAALLPFVAR